MSWFDSIAAEADALDRCIDMRCPDFGEGEE